MTPTLVQISGYDGVVYGLCAKAVSSSNNVKSGSVCADTSFIRACLDNISPQSRAYGSHSGDAYFQGSFGQSFFTSQPDIQAAAATPADTVGVCGR